MRGVTWVVIEESKSGDWGIGGQPAHHRGRPLGRSQESPPSHDAHRRHRRSPPRGHSPPQSPASPSSGGVRIGYEVFGQGEETLLLLPPWSIIHSRFWKGQVPYLARHFRVITYDPRGNGRSDRPDSAGDYGPHDDAEDALAVLDATGTARCVFVAHCAIAGGALLLAADHAERVAGAVFMTPALPDHPTAAGARRPFVRGRAARVRGLGEDQPPLLGARLPRLPRVLLRPLPARAALDEADRGRRRLGPRRDAGDARAHHRGARHGRAERARADGPHPLPGARHPGRRGPC